MTSTPTDVTQADEAFARRAYHPLARIHSQVNCEFKHTEYLAPLFAECRANTPLVKEWRDRALLKAEECGELRGVLDILQLAADEINGDIDLQVNGDQSDEVDVGGAYYVTLSAAKVAAMNSAICAAQKLLRDTESQRLAHQPGDGALREALADLLSWFPDKPPQPEWRITAGKFGADDAVEHARSLLKGGSES